MKSKNYKQTKITKYFKKNRNNQKLLIMIKNLNII